LKGGGKMIKEEKYEIVVKTKEPFRVGGTKDPLSGAENPVTVVGGRVVIPGPSLKGAFRAEVERYLIEKYYDKANERWPTEKRPLQPCIPGPRLSPDEQELVAKQRYRGDACHYPCTRKCENGEHMICPACYLLGAQGLNGFLRVPFLYSDVSAGELYSARMDRAKGVVAEGTNRPFEVVPDNTIFKGTLTVLRKDLVKGLEFGTPRVLRERTAGDRWLELGEWESEQILKDLIVERFKNISLLGGFKSKGFGGVEITVTPHES
jgi:CRISPR/Cas system CSM-associated protein Csm3 (group 7 of RAMP superfamily)